MKKLCMLLISAGVCYMSYASEIRIVDPEATAQTKSLYEYLKTESGRGVLFGHQNTTHQGITIDPSKKNQSDVYNAIGDYPAIFGLDFLDIIDSKTDAKLKGYIDDAYDLGAIITVSDHMQNFTTGKYYDDTTRAVRNILPGGKDFLKYKAYLDSIAKFVKTLKDKDGNPIPMIYRPFHENHGSWFWWGAAFCSKAEFIALWRYTVDYLKSSGVHNFIYAYSPSGGFNGSRDEYLKRYPGDGYVDILAFDWYDKDTNDNWYQLMINDCEMLVRLAEEKNKIPAIAETGVTNGIKLKDNPNKEWYSKRMMDIILHDEVTRKIVYFMVWRNGNEGHFWVPFKNSVKYGNHEMLNDFEQFYKNPYVVFLKGLKGVYDLKDITTVPIPNYVYFMNPLNKDTVTGDQKIIVRTNVPVDRIKNIEFYTGKDKIPLEKKGDFYETGWNLGGIPRNTTQELTVILTLKSGEKLSDTVTVKIRNKSEQAGEVVDDFRNYIDSEELMDTYVPGNGARITLLNGSEVPQMKYDYSLGMYSYTGVNRAIDRNNDWSTCKGIQFNLKHDLRPAELTVQIVANKVYWEAYADLSKPIASPAKFYFKDFKLPPWLKGDYKLNLSNVTGLSIYVGEGNRHDKIEGSLFIDDLKLISN